MNARYGLANFVLLDFQVGPLRGSRSEDLQLLIPMPKGNGTVNRRLGEVTMYQTLGQLIDAGQITIGGIAPGSFAVGGNGA